MSSSDHISLEEKLTHLEKHVSEQDLEIFRLRKELADAQAAIQKLADQFATIEGGGPQGPGSPADERPPHY